MKTILVVDDDADTRAAIRSSLGSYQVLEAPHGRVALAVIAVTPVDLVITDIFMPEMDGLELIRALKKQTPDMPIIAISGGGRFDLAGSQLSLASRFGAEAMIRKPYDRQELERTVDLVLQGKGAPPVSS